MNVIAKEMRYCGFASCCNFIDKAEGMFCEHHPRLDTKCDADGCSAEAVVKDDVVGGSKAQWCRHHGDMFGPPHVKSDDGTEATREDTRDCGVDGCTTPAQPRIAWCKEHTYTVGVTPDDGTDVGLDCLNLAQSMSFNLGSAVVLLCKADMKSSIDSPLSEAKFYINREIERLAECARKEALRQNDE